MTVQASHNSTLYIPDIDECIEDIDGCVQTCTNTMGSYTCSCNAGYRLASDNHGCNGGWTFHDKQICIIATDFMILI